MHKVLLTDIQNFDKNTNCNKQQNKSLELDLVLKEKKPQHELDWKKMLFSKSELSMINLDEKKRNDNFSAWPEIQFMACGRGLITFINI